jgi:cAMP phosphodiesterase
MKIKIVGSAVDSECPGQQFAASYVINNGIAIDAGSIGLQSSIAVQRQIKHVFLSHGHLDHIASLPMFLDNVYESGPECVQIYALQETLDSLQQDVFNDRVWPDLVRLSQEEAVFMKLHPMQVGETIQADELRVTALPLDHVVPTIGFIVSDGSGSVAFVSDTAPLDSIWQTLNQVTDLKALFLESAFPTRMNWLATKAKHLTPTLFAEGCRKLLPAVPIIAVHIKPAFHDEIVSEFAALKLPRVTIGSPDVTYEF